MRDIIVLSTALALSLVGSYMVWTGDEEVIDDEAVQVYAAGPADLVSLTWDSEDSKAVVTRKTDAKGDYLWVEATTRTKKRITPDPDHPEVDGDRPITPEELQEAVDEQAADEAPSDEEEPAEGADDEAPEEEPEEDAYEVVETTKAFKGSKQADEMWEAFAPLFALRELSGGADKREAFGLDEPTGTVTVERAKGTITLTVGGETYGSKNKYVSREDQDRVFLLDDATLRPLQFAASRLTDRALLPFTGDDVRKLVVTLPSGTGFTYLQQNADDPANAFWSTAADPETADETAGTWIDKLFRMRLRNYTASEDAPTVLTPVFTYTASDQDGNSWAVEVLQATGEEGATEWYARSEHTRSLVQIPESLASGVVEDLESLGN